MTQSKGWIITQGWSSKRIDKMVPKVSDQLEISDTEQEWFHTEKDISIKFEKMNRRKAKEQQKKFCHDYFSLQRS